MDVFFRPCWQVLAPHTFGIMLVGIAIGLLVGILPGLGGAATLAMMLPFVYPMDAISAFAFLLGMHAVTATTGDITPSCSAFRARQRRRRPCSTDIR